MLRIDARWMGTIAVALAGGLLQLPGCHWGAGDVSLGTDGVVSPDGGAGDSGSAGEGSGGTQSPDSGQGGASGSAGAGTGGTGIAGSGGSSGTGGSGPDDCFSPWQNLNRVPDGPTTGIRGCACSIPNEGHCVLDATGRELALHCIDGHWMSVEDGACMPGIFDYRFCGLPKDTGQCFIVGQPRYWFNSSTGECEWFEFYCMGNANNFVFEHECEKACEVPDRGPACSTPPSSNSCAEPTTAFYYDPHWRDCKEFSWGGCTNSPNVFRTREECAATCPTTWE
jgi:hypothetical protein